MNQRVIAEFRANDGRVPSFGGAPILLLSHKGAKTGKEHLSPLVYTTDGDRYVIVASKGGAPSDPQWYRNLVADGSVTVEVGTERFAAQAHTVGGAERDRLFAAHAAMMPQFDDYAAATSRVIPVVVLERV